MRDLLRLELLGEQFVQMCADLFSFCKAGGLLFLCCEKIHLVLHPAAEIMRNLVNSSGEAAEGTHNMDLIQVGVSVTSSRKKRILCVCPKAGPAQPAALSGHYILYTTCV